MLPQIIVILGLFLDALGALSIAVPDLPGTIQNKIRSYTPFLRSIHHSQAKIDEARPVDDDRERFIEDFETIWPAMQSNMNVGSFDEVNLDFGDSYPPISIYTPKIDKRYDVEETRFIRNANAYIDKHYRVFGWICLFVGFLLQLIANISTL
jgi:hypothetical protein